MSLERLMALARPFSANTTVFVRYSKTIVFPSFLVSSVYLSPLTFGMDAYNFLNSANKTEYLPLKKPDLKYLINAIIIIETVVLNLIAPFFLLIINVGIIVAYSRFNRQRVKVVKVDQSKKQSHVDPNRYLDIGILYTFVPF